MAKNQAQSGNEAAGEPPRGGALRALEAGLEGLFFGFLRLLRRRAPDIALAAAVVGGLLLLYAETLELYRIVTPSGATSNAAGSIKTGSDQHSWSLGVIGVVIAAAACLSRWTGQRLPAWAAVALAVIALAIILVVDLPDVTSSGLTQGELEVAEAEPRGGFWVELVGALLALGGAAALALQLSRAARARRRRT